MHLTRIYRKVGLCSRAELSRQVAEGRSTSPTRSRLVGFPETCERGCEAYGRGVFKGAGRTFLVESYVPGLDERPAATLSPRVREGIRRLDEEGTTFRCGGSFALVDEETYTCMIGAPKDDDVIQLSERAGLEHDHIVEAFVIDAPATQGRRSVSR